MWQSFFIYDLNLFHSLMKYIRTYLLFISFLYPAFNILHFYFYHFIIHSPLVIFYSTL